MGGNGNLGELLWEPKVSFYGNIRETLWEPKN